MRVQRAVCSAILCIEWSGKTLHNLAAIEMSRPGWRMSAAGYVSCADCLATLVSDRERMATVGVMQCPVGRVVGGRVGHADGERSLHIVHDGQYIVLVDRLPCRCRTMVIKLVRILHIKHFVNE